MRPRCGHVCVTAAGRRQVELDYTGPPTVLPTNCQSRRLRTFPEEYEGYRRRVPQLVTLAEVYAGDGREGEVRERLRRGVDKVMNLDRFDRA